jgi:hypothetical protein
MGDAYYNTPTERYTRALRRWFKEASPYATPPALYVPPIISSPKENGLRPAKKDSRLDNL